VRRVIECRNLYKSFGDTVVFKEFSYQIADTGIHTIIGPSGCGKTTLVRIIMGLEQSDAGFVTGVDGLKFSAVFAEDRLIPTLTALDNIDYPIGQPEQSLYWLGQMQMSEQADSYPFELSAGMKRRVGLARALAFSGVILILDEPFKGLDLELQQHILGILQAYAQNHPVILLSHEIIYLLKEASVSLLDLGSGVATDPSKVDSAAIKRPRKPGDALKEGEGADALSTDEMLANLRNRQEGFMAENGLTNREHEVFFAMSEGLTMDGVASKLVISQRTVKFHYNNIFRKLAVSSKAEALQKFSNL
jgi:NitT/TauT family transport system ATP-binding protein